MDNFTLPAILLSLLLLITTCLTLCFYSSSLAQKWRINSPSSLNSRSQSVTPPSPWPRLPIIGHLHLLTDMPHHTFAQLAHRLGPIFTLQLGQVPTLIISSAPLARLVLKTHDHVFANRPQLLGAQWLSFGCSDVTFSPYGRYWRQARKICVTELLSSKRVSSFKLVRDEEVERLLNVVSTQSETETDMTKLFFSLSNDILCRVAFGRRFAEEGEKGNLVDVLTETQELLAGFCVGDFFPRWEWVNSVSGFKGRLKKNLEDLRRVCEEIIEEHLQRRERSGVNAREDFVDVLLRVQQREDLEVAITDDNLKALVLDMFVAGTDTTSATLEWVMTELIRHPNVMKRAQEEVREGATGSNGEIDETHLQHFGYLKAVIKEAMRLHPPVPLLVPRESIDTCELDDYQIPAKTRVLINAYAIGRDPNSWEDPLEFNPARFYGIDSDVKDQDFRFLPFGGGRRGCPGFNFGLATVETALARLLYHFDWGLPQGIRAEDIDLGEVFGLATRKRSSLVLVPTACQHYQFNKASA